LYIQKLERPTKLEKCITTLETLLESIEKYQDEDTQDVVKKDEGISGGVSGEGGQSEEYEMDEALKDTVKNIFSSLTGSASEILHSAVKGSVEGLLQSKDEKLLNNAAKAYGELLRRSGVNATDETAKNLLDKILAKNIVKVLEAKRAKDNNG